MPAMLTSSKTKSGLILMICIKALTGLLIVETEKISSSKQRFSSCKMAGLSSTQTILYVCLVTGVSGRLTGGLAVGATGLLTVGGLTVTG